MFQFQFMERKMKMRESVSVSSVLGRVFSLWRESVEGKTFSLTYRNEFALRKKVVPFTKWRL